MKSILSFFLFTAAFSFLALHSNAQFTLSVGVKISTSPPPLPVYTQPACPVDGYLWSPGYWAYDEIDGYYWVPGVWTMPPTVGYLWTPGYWGYSGGFYGWHGGYWGEHIGFYGGVNYGYGYGGSGFYGGAWRGGSFRYNTAVVNVNTTVVHNTYVDRTVINNTTINNTTVNNRSSFNGVGGTTAQPSTQEQAATRENHVQPTTEQVSHNQTASRDRNQFASVNNGRPATTAMNTVGGQRFNQEGKNAPPPAPRPSGGIKAASTNNNHAVNPVRSNAARNNSGLGKPASHPLQQSSNKPGQVRQKPQPPKKNVPHPRRAEEGHHN
jgi:YXWGXW repeat-containing protein